MTPPDPAKTGGKGEAATVAEKAGVAAIPAATAPPEPPAEPPAPPPAPAPDIVVPVDVAITGEAFIAGDPARTVLGAALLARNPEYSTLQLTEAEWLVKLGEEHSTPAGPIVPDETPADG